MHYELKLNYDDGQRYTKTINTFLLNIGFEYEGRIYKAFTFKLEVKLSIFVTSSKGRKDLPEIKNKPSGTSLLLDSLKSPVLPGLDITVGYKF